MTTKIQRCKVVKNCLNTYPAIFNTFLAKSLLAQYIHNIHLGFLYENRIKLMKEMFKGTV